MNTITDSIVSLNSAWPEIQRECLSVLGSELHYQAMIYYHLRLTGGVPIAQVGMNVKMYITNPASALFRRLDERKHKDYRGGFEPIPDVAIFRSGVEGDWRRRNHEKTIIEMLMAIEVKASERKDSRLQPSEIIFDIQKLAAHREEAIHLGSDFVPVMLIIDSALNYRERMTESSLETSMKMAEDMDVRFMYCSRDINVNTLNPV